jgi:hypothetical protein
MVAVGRNADVSNACRYCHESAQCLMLASGSRERSPVFPSPCFCLRKPTSSEWGRLHFGKRWARPGSIHPACLGPTLPFDSARRAIPIPLPLPVRDSVPSSVGKERCYHWSPPTRRGMRHRRVFTSFSNVPPAVFNGEDWLNVKGTSPLSPPPVSPQQWPGVPEWGLSETRALDPSALHRSYGFDNAIPRDARPSSLVF